MLTGRYEHNVDAKGRVFVPAKFRADLQGELVIAKGIDAKCVVIYTKEQWNIVVGKIESHGEISMKSILRFLHASSFSTELDSQGRVVIPPELREFANIEKDISFIGLNYCVELWRPENFDAVNDEANVDEMMEMLKNVGF